VGILHPNASKSAAFLLFIAAASTPVCAQREAPASQRTRLQLAVQCSKQDQWRTVDAQSVFKQGDRIRFRFRTSLPGYLYILNHSSGGQVSWLYPPPGNSSNRVEAGREIIIPASDGSYAIGGPPGFDTLYWILRSTRFEVPDLNAGQLDAPSTLISRCREEERQEIACLDKNAGPKPLENPNKLETALGIGDSLVARDLTFESKPQATEIGTDSDGVSSGIIYQVRIAHN
jgi:Domain of unknown function (DUF4384)